MMTFTVRDLMLHVLPDAAANAPDLRLCTIATGGEPLVPPKPGVPKPGEPKPVPPQPGKPQPGKSQPVPECALATGGQGGTGASAELASLAVLREQLRQALHP
jgi:hypothetical protein